MMRWERSDDRICVGVQEELLHKVPDVLVLVDVDETVGTIADYLHAEVVLEGPKILHLEKGEEISLEGGNVGWRVTHQDEVVDVD